eukprot:3146497-Rhodomonas_salina.1
MGIVSSRVTSSMIQPGFPSDNAPMSTACCAIPKRHSRLGGVLSRSRCVGAERSVCAVVL